MNWVDPAGVAGTFWFEGTTESVCGAAAWVTVTVTGERPLAVTVMVAVREIVSVFSV